MKIDFIKDILFAKNFEKDFFTYNIWLKNNEELCNMLYFIDDKPNMSFDLENTSDNIYIDGIDVAYEIDREREYKSEEENNEIDIGQIVLTAIRNVKNK